MKRKPRFSYNRWEFKRVKCPYCGKEISENWISRHINKKHFAVILKAKSV